MTLALQSPLGLLALAALPALWWLHHFVLRGPDVPVSCVALWRESGRPELEGSTRQRPPLTWVLLLEAVAVVALALVVADVRVILRPTDRPRIGVVVDRSASMGGGPGGSSAWKEVQELLPSLGGGDVRVTVVGSGTEPARLGETAVTPREAVRTLAAEIPSLPDHPLEPALELAMEMGFAREELVVFSDRDLELDRLTRVGKPASNTGIVNATWEPGQPPTVALRHFGGEPRPATLTMEAEGAPPRSIAIPWDARGAALLRPEVPAGADAVTFRLPGDALVADDRVTLLRPSGRRPRARVELPSAVMRRAFERALAAAGVELASGDAGGTELLVTARTAGEGGASVFRVVVPAAAAPLTDPIFVLDRGSPLVEGVDAQGLVWAGRRDLKAEHPLLVSGGTPLIWREGAGLAIQVDPARSNLLQHPAFALLVANWVQGVAERQGSLARRNYHVGERLRFAPRADCGADLQLRTPSGRDRALPAGGPVIDAGPLLELGVYRLSCGNAEERLAVNLLDAAEGDLTARKPDGRLPDVRARIARAGAATSLLQGLLLLAALLAAAGAWLMLARGRSAGRAP